MVQYFSMRDDVSELRADFKSQVKDFVHKAKDYSNALQKNSYYSFQKAIQRGRLWRPDKGAAVKEITREEKKLPALIDMGSGNGLSKIRFRGLSFFQQLFHNILRDFFTTVASLSIYEVVLVMICFYLASYLVWGFLWHLVNKYDGRCIVNVNNFLDALIFAIATQSTIGYGNSSPGPCWLSSFMLAGNAVYGMLIDSIFLGVIFSLISHPKQRARTIFVSENCVICKRDGILKLLFRVGDTRQYPVVSPVVKAFVYFWGRGFETHEQEQLPVRIEPLTINYMDYQLILPLACEHNIDSTSPLYQHTKESLEALDAEIVVIVEGSNEFGNSFMTRVSYLASEILWGHLFQRIIHRAQKESYHEVDLGHFHDTELMKEYQDRNCSQREISHELVKMNLKPQQEVLPPTLRGENTIVISQICVINRNNSSNQLQLQFRIADRYPNQMLQVQVKAYCYSWIYGADNNVLDHTVQVLNLGQWQGERALLRTPIIVSHIIDNNSPLRHWQTVKNVYNDRSTEIFVLVEASKMISNDVVTTTRSFTPREQVKWGKKFFPVVIKKFKSPALAVAWNSFNETLDHADTQQLQSIASGTMSPRYTYRDHSMDTLLGLCPKWDYIRQEMIDNDDDDEGNIIVPINTQIELQESTGSKEEQLAGVKLRGLQVRGQRSSSIGDFSELLQRDTKSQRNTQGSSQNNGSVNIQRSTLKRSLSEDKVDGQAAINRQSISQELQRSQHLDGQVHIPLIPPPPVQVHKLQANKSESQDFTNFEDSQQFFQSPQDNQKSINKQFSRTSSNVGNQSLGNRQLSRNRSSLKKNISDASNNQKVVEDVQSNAPEASNNIAETSNNEDEASDDDKQLLTKDYPKS